MGSFPYPRNGILKLDYEFILVFKKPGDGPKVSQDIKELSKMTAEEWNQFFAGHWNFAGERQDKHLAMFPEELPRRLIKMFSYIGDTVLDPFLGSGTTCLAARNLERNSIGYEINPDYEATIREKLNANQNKLFGSTNITFQYQPRRQSNFDKEIQALPYIFKDPIRFDKKTDPKKYKFGSQIDYNHHKREEYYRVEQVISPSLVILDNGLKVRLLGIKEQEDTREAAIQFLENKTKGQKVFLKFDSIKYDQDNILLGYLYLSNKTFVNSHLIKMGYANIDISLDFKYKARFLSLRRPAAWQKNGF